LKTSKGSFVSVTFTKKDGEIRVLNGRTGVSKDVKGVGLSYNPDDYNNLIIRDVQKQAYRTVKQDALISAKISGEEYAVIDDEFIEHLEQCGACPICEAYEEQFEEIDND
tara:strand:+ start:1116 stop:1445 length:330 start_codon:yes stop_codon:yes gene_type:complete